MDDLLKNIPRKNIIIFIVVSFLIIILFTVISGGIVVVESKNSSNIEGTVSRLDETSDDKSIELDSLFGKIIYLKNGSYNLKFENSKNSQETNYQLHVSGLSINNIRLDFKNQKNSLNIGYSPFGCSYYDLSNLQVAYYDCLSGDKANQQIELSKDGGNTVFPVKNYSHLSFYMGGVIGVDTTQPKLSSGYLADNQFVVTSQSTIDKSILNGGELVTNTTSKDDPRFAVFNNKKRNITVFRHVGDSEPLIIGLKDNVTNRSEHRVLLTEKYVYVFSGNNPDSSLGESDNTSDKTPEQRLTIFDTTNGSTVKTHIIPNELVVKGISTNEKNRAALVAFDKNNNINNILKTSPDLQKLESNIIGNFADSNFCYIGNDIYYKDINSKLLSYSTINKGSFLSYENTSGDVANISCLYKNIYLALVGSDGLYDDTSYRHIVLESTDYGSSYVRSESLLPIIGIDGISTADIYLNNINVILNKPESVGGCVVDESKRNSVLLYFKNKGFDTNNLTFNVNYQCQSATGDSSDVFYDAPAH